MDKLSGFASKFGGSNFASANEGQTEGQPQAQNQEQNQEQQGQPEGQQEDYLDRGLDSLEQRFGGGKIDSAKMRSTNEKITDAAREQFEKATGYKVPEKFSN